MVQIQPDGEVVERHHRRLRIDTPEDVERYGAYPIYIDENRALAAVEAFVIDRDGRRRKVSRRGSDRVDHAGAFELASSASYHVVLFELLTPGAEWIVDYEVQVAPYYPAGSVTLGDPLDTLNVSVEILGGGAGFRHRLTSSKHGLAVEQMEGGVRVTGTNLGGVEALSWEPSGAQWEPRLLYAWSGGSGWGPVVNWYLRLLEDVPRNSSTVAAKAKSLAVDAKDRRSKLERVLDFLRRKVRYEAVEMGIGGFRPSAPEEVLGRRWGDCKDKGLLLIEMLAAHGIEAYPALIRAGGGAPVRADLESPYQFNHLIVAVPIENLEVSRDDPTSAGYLFLDPTQTRGSAAWLTPDVQGKQVLLVRNGQKRLIRTPIRFDREATTVLATAQLDTAGNLHGEVELIVRGALASSLIEGLAEQPGLTNQITNRALRELTSLHRSTADQVSLYDKPVPEVRILATVQATRVVRGSGDRRSLQLPQVLATPDPAALRGRATPARVPVGQRVSVWRIALPSDWCAPSDDEVSLVNSAGGFHQVVTSESGQLRVERRTEVYRQWLEDAGLADLYALSVAERRAAKRRIRLDCPERSLR